MQSALEGAAFADALEPLPPIKRKQLMQKLDGAGSGSASPPLPSPARSEWLNRLLSGSLPTTPARV